MPVRLIALLGLLVVAVPAYSQEEEEQEVAFTNAEQAGPDFDIQGEYSGSISGTISSYPRQTVGLQVISRGDGKFEAVLYPGGLPGSGWFGGSKTQLVGEAADSGVDLISETRLVHVGNDAAEVKNVTGESLGRLEKVERESATLGAKPPRNAVVIFSGSETKELSGARITEDGLLMEGSEFVKPYTDFTMHVEFQTPFMPYSTEQGRGNSGVYIQSRYEVQILDSFGLEGVDNECGGLYKYKRPGVNMCLPPLSWQTYDIRFTAAKFDKDGNKTDNARLSVWQNGVVIHDNVSIERKTGGGAQEGPEALPIKLQDHHDPVRFRNIWLVDHTAPTSSESTPSLASSGTVISGGSVSGGSVTSGYTHGVLPVGPYPLTVPDLAVGVWGSYEPAMVGPAGEPSFVQFVGDYPPVPTVILPPPAPYWLH